LSTVAPIIDTESFEYRHGDIVFDGALVADRDVDADRRPAVLVLEGIEGRTEVQVDVARRLATQGYLGVAVDLFGGKRLVPGRSAAPSSCRSSSRTAMRCAGACCTWLDVVRSRAGVDPDRVATIGFCFGGLCVLDLARAGAEVSAVASSHGLLTPPGLTPGTPITARVAVFHGWEDPFATCRRHSPRRGADPTWRRLAGSRPRPRHARLHGRDSGRPRGPHPVRPGRRTPAWASLEWFLTEAFAVP